MNQNQAPIGIFDSGIGGLTVAAALLQKRKDLPVVYFGDTAHLPYGDKSPEVITGLVNNVLKFLSLKGCKTVIAACNSASSVLHNVCIPKGVEVVDVIDPVVNSISEKYSNKTIGVIGTRQTIGSGIYAIKLKEKFPQANVVSLATPLLAPLIEEKFVSGQIAKDIISEYLTKLGPVNALILGCTHYPLIQNHIDAFYKGNVELISAPSVILDLMIDENKLFPNNILELESNNKQQFFVSDLTESFQQTAEFFFDGVIDLKLV